MRVRSCFPAKIKAPAKRSLVASLASKITITALYRSEALLKSLRVRYNLHKMAAHPYIASPRIDPNFAPFKLRLGRSGIHGLGVYAAEPIPARHKVIEYTGERISRRETRRRGMGPRTYQIG